MAVFKKLFVPCKKTTKRIIFVVLFQGHVYPCEHFECIRGAFCFFAEKLRNFIFYENLRFQKNWVLVSFRLIYWWVSIAHSFRVQLSTSATTVLPKPVSADGHVYELMIYYFLLHSSVRIGFNCPRFKCFVGKMLCESVCWMCT